jgi:hypothetical protein
MHLHEVKEACLSFGSASATDSVLVSNACFDARFYLHMLRAYWKSAHKMFIERVWQIVGDELVRSSVNLAEVSNAIAASRQCVR